MENKTDSTGSLSLSHGYKTIKYKFGEYNIVVTLNDKNEFVGIQEIGVNKNFYNYKSIKGDFDIRKYLD